MHFISDIKEPAAVFISTVKPGTELGYGTEVELNKYNMNAVLNITNYLREIGIDAVPFYDKECADASKTVVTLTGIQSPILTPKKAKEFAMKVTQLSEKLTQERCIDSFHVVSMYPVQGSQFSPISATSKKKYGGEIEPDINNTDINEIRAKYGFDLEYKLCKEAMNSPQLISIEDIVKKNEEGVNFLYRGGSLGDNPYALLNFKEGKNIVYSSPNIKTALEYSGAKGWYGCRMKAHSSNDKEEDIRFGLVYEYEASKTTEIYSDYSMENGMSPFISKKSSEIKSSEYNDNVYIETPVFPEKNKCTNIYMHLKKDGKEYLYPIPKEDERWKALLQLYRAYDTSQRGFMIDRRENILAHKTVHKSFGPKNILGLFRKKIPPFKIKEDINEIIAKSKQNFEDKRRVKTIGRRQKIKDINAYMQNVKTLLKSKTSKNEHETKTTVAKANIYNTQIVQIEQER